MVIGGFTVAVACTGATGGIGLVPYGLAGLTMSGSGVVLVYSGVKEYSLVYKIGRRNK